MRCLLAILLWLSALGPPLSAVADWQPIGNNQYLWTDLLGKSDGQVYGWAFRHGYWQYYVIRPLTADELRALNPPPQLPPEQSQPTQQYLYGNGNGKGGPEGNWRYRAVQVVANQIENEDFQATMQQILSRGRGAAAYGGGGGGYQTNQQSANLSQYGLRSPGMFLGDLPVQQGNTVYGSLDPSYNSFAEPLRRLDFRTFAREMLVLQKEYEAGAARVSSDGRVLFQDMIQVAGKLEEQAMYYEGVLAALAQIEKGRPASGSQSFRLQSGSSTPATAGASAAVGGDGLEAVFREFSGVIGRRCLHCHGGAKSTDASKVLLLGTADRVELSTLAEAQARKMFERVEDGSMPKDGKLSSEERAVFDRMKGRLLK